MAKPKPIQAPWPDEPSPLAVWDGGGIFTREKAEKIYELTKDWPPEQCKAALDYIEAQKNRSIIRRRYANTAELAASVDSAFVVTPAISIISDAVEMAIQYPRTNLLVTMPPQEGKSTTCAVWAPIRALQLNPHRRIILTTYGGALAETHSAACRDLIMRFGTGVVDALTGLPVEDKLGLQLDPKSNRVSAWKVNGADGGMIAAGISASITGRRADLMIIDDPYKNMMEADSAAYRKKVSEWFSSVAMTRLSPDASIILIQTRWHPEDLSGEILAGELELEPEDRTWKHINIPAVSYPGIPDALERPEPGISMKSTRGRTLADFRHTEKLVGPRTWFALYEGSPRNPEGGLFKRSWFEDHYLQEIDIPRRPIASVVAIDPADSGEGDECGLIGASVAQSGSIIFSEDWSGLMTSDEWGKAAVKLALTMGASEIAVEAYASATTYVNVVRSAYKAMHIEAVRKKQQGAKLTAVERRALAEIAPFTIHRWRGEGDDVVRSALLRQGVETGRCRHVEGRFDTYEAQACDWQAGQHQPDRVAAGVIAYDRLYAKSEQQMSLAKRRDETKKRNPPGWMKRELGGDKRRNSGPAI